MPNVSSPRLSYAAAALFLLVVAILFAPLGALVSQVVARSMGGNQPPRLQVSPDPLSDSVAATAAEFRVDESGAATYSVPLYTVPGTAGVVPQLSLSYSSQGGYGPVGKGWSIGGTSTITRCRATREAGDFLGAATPDGNPAPINFSATDRYCLDGQRLIPSSAACPSAGGMTATALATEIDSFQRVCAYTTASSANGPRFFTVERKDGSISWYGDRDNSTNANRPDGYFETTSPLNPAAALTWAQTRFQDSTGNYIDYLYLENPAGAGTGEHLLSEVRYTGKNVLSGQAGSASAPYARVVFNYAVRPAAQWSKGYASGGVLTQSRRLDSITSCASITCAVTDQARHYLLTYADSTSGSLQETLIGLQECRDSTGAVCAAPTAFAWSQGKHEFATSERPSDLQVNIGNFKGFKLGDVNGDGLTDFVYLKTGSGQCGATEHMVVALGSLNASGTPGFTNGQVVCTPVNIRDRGEGAWHLFDYDGDGRDDLFLSTAVGQGWRIYLSNGAGFDAAQNPIAGLSPVIPSVDGKNDQVQLADLNGDGLTDVVYPRAGALRARVMERQAGGFGWGAERTVLIDHWSLEAAIGECHDFMVTCTQTIAGAPTPKTGFMQMADFNGDAASDLLLQVTTRIERFTQYPGCNLPPLSRSAPTESEWVSLPYVAELEEAQSRAGAMAVIKDPCWDVTISNLLHALVVKETGTQAVGISHYGILSGGNPHSLSLADVNGDGLTEAFVRVTNSSEWYYVTNTGAGFQGASSVPLRDFHDQTRFVDVNGDGRADVLHPFNGGSYKAYNVKYALPGGGYSAEGWLPGVPGRYANALLCQTSGCDPERFVPIFADLDGDGHVDFMSIKMDDNPDLFVSRSNAAGRHSPRDTLLSITNGLGAQTDITYAPLTNKEVYRRGAGARNGVTWGRGSPVMDLLAPSYVVARASSSSPQAGAPNAMASVHYRYANARVQAGGRGYLGFETIETIDPNQSGGYVVTTTRYAQNFPYIGMPVQTTKKAVTGAAYLVPTCLSGGMRNICFSTPGQVHTDLGGSWFSNSVQSWEVSPANLAAQAALHVRTLGTEEVLRDPFTGAQTSKVATAFGYGSHGNVTKTIVDTYTGAEPSPTATLITTNTYADDVGKWRLGRLSASTVTHRRPGQPDVVRTSGFSYDMGGAATGQLTEERTQPGGAADQALANAYLLDSYGNRVLAVTCAAPATSCNTNGFEFHPTDAAKVRRYSRIQYDAQGRFPVATSEPFWSEAGHVEAVTSRVLGRNVFGDAVDTLDVNNVRSVAVKGALGRDYYAWAQSSPEATLSSGGIASLTTYRWCSQVACPVGARFRQQIAVQGAPRQWVYFDVLGRPVMKASESFNAGVIDQDVSAVCTDYDATGKPVRASHPFFLAGTAGSAGPTGIEAVCTAAARQWTVSSYDVLGRAVRVLAADGSQVSSRYAGLTTTSTDQRGNATVQAHNGKGELSSVTDAAGLVTSYAYTADGNLRTVSRNAGAGVITNSFTYDALGRKIRQVDPDTGTTTFQYNALGELIAQTDAAGQRTEHEIDARGRVWRKRVKLVDDTVESQAVFTFDTAANGLGSLAVETMAGTYTAWVGQAGTSLDYRREYGYDALGRPAGMGLYVDWLMLGATTQYDALGRPWKSRDVSGLWTKTQYSARGAAVAVCASSEGDLSPTCANGAGTYQRTLRTDAWGNVTRERRGDSAAMEVSRSYNAQTGRIATICAGNAACNLTNEAYGWDAAGNLSSHQKEQRYLESFKYDSLNRLIEGRVLTQNGASVNVVTLSNGYDRLGNICSKSGLGYGYAGAAGCSGAGTLSAPVMASASMGDSRSAAPSYQRPAPIAWQTPSAWRNRHVWQAPETASRRYSEADDDRPSWEHEADSWGIGDELTLKPGQSFWVPGKRAAPQAEPRLEFQSPTVPNASSDPLPLAAGSGSPHAVSQTGTGTSATFYYYDGRGNQTVRDAPGTANDRTIVYSADDKAHEIRMGSGQRVRFWYGPDGQRYKREEAGKTTYYVGGVEVVVQSGVTTFKRYLGGIALQTVVEGGVQATQYLFHDHLGSLVRIANADGSVAESMDYTAFGDRRSYSNPNAAGTASVNTPRGFTGHEYVDGTGVIHMNGRIYDQELGRFLQADPVIQAPDNAQSWNAYTYVFNNPLAYTDPSGNISLKKALGFVIGVVAAVFGQYYITQGMYAAAFGVAVAGGFAAGYVASGTLKGGLQGAFTAGMTFGVASLFMGANPYLYLAAQAMTGGVVELLQGGNFGSGFVAAGLTAAFMPMAGHRNPVVGAVRGALIGGTISEITGGKFANGAISGAIQGAMAKTSSSVNGNDKPRDPGSPQEARNAMHAFNTTMVDENVFMPYGSWQEASDAFGRIAVKLDSPIEVGVLIGEAGGKFFLGPAWSRGSTDNVTGLFENASLPEGTALAAAAHNHPGGINYLSGGGYGYALGKYGADGKMMSFWGQGGDMRSAYNLKTNIAAYSSAGADYFSYSKYVEIQRVRSGPVPLCMGATSGCDSY